MIFFEDVRSERLLMRYAADRLSVRWYLGYDLNEPLPDHSGLTKIRTRYGIEVFRRFFEVVEQCQEAGLVWGKELYFDGTKVAANAGKESVKPRYHTHYVVDGGRARIIVAALVTPSEVMDNQPMLDLLWWTRFRGRLWPQHVTGDKKYGTEENLVAIEDQGLRAYIPIADMDHRTTFFSVEAFTYSAERDVYVCLVGKEPHLFLPIRHTPETVLNISKIRIQ